ncbi:hypothetical protein [Erysipelothrix aquatica]|uniref:hypothetical protein n=1 Tax=Erysipelothrix aquatica TaxID=2683714 RepID=UPI0013594BC6|nr:hypothetical protein [Erysipelothrix aquatica]
MSLLISVLGMISICGISLVVSHQVLKSNENIRVNDIFKQRQFILVFIQVVALYILFTFFYSVSPVESSVITLGLISLLISNTLLMMSSRQHPYEPYGMSMLMKVALCLWVLNMIRIVIEQLVGGLGL